MDLSRSQNLGFELPLRIVAIGGGTGLSTLLHGLKPHVPQRLAFGPDYRSPAVDITAIVTVTDDGGSSGRLRRQFGVPPPGDIRSCMTALARDEDLLTKLFSYRFETGQGLKGHSFGNLLLTALADITGDFQTAVRVASAVLAISGRIYPSTDSRVVLQANLKSGRTVRGETRISRARSRIMSISLDPPTCRPLPETLSAIATADLICLGPGSLFTSVLPNLMVKGIPEAIEASPAVKVYIVNLMGQTRETLGFTAADHIRPILEHAGQGILDYAIVNSAPFTESHLARYSAEGVGPVAIDHDELERLGVSIVTGKLIDNLEKVRHDPDALAELVISLAEEGRRRKLFGSPASSAVFSN